MSAGVWVVGGGLAGSEAAWQLARLGIPVRLWEMRPLVETPAHTGGDLAQLVCSNSLGSTDTSTASGLLMAELRQGGSLLLEAAEACRVPAGGSLSVDREALARHVTRVLEETPGITLVREEFSVWPEEGQNCLLATGPLTSPALVAALVERTGADSLYFYDATSPVVAADSIDMSRVYEASRYGKGTPDFLNIPLEQEAYASWVDALVRAETVPLNEADRALFFEGCLPVEEIARRGPQTLAFGPMKPVGLEDPRTGQRPWAVVQLRRDDLRGEGYQMVGFQTRLTYGEQGRVFRMLPGLEKARFLRFGRVHRNTYLCAPRVLREGYALVGAPHVMVAGQLSGVEGYVESIAAGWTAGRLMADRVAGRMPSLPPPETALGALARALQEGRPEDFAPTKFTFGLLPPLEETGKRRCSKKDQKRLRAERALTALASWLSGSRP